MNGLTTFQRDKSDYQAKILSCKFPAVRSEASIVCALLHPPHGGKTEEEMGPLLPIKFMIKMQPLKKKKDKTDMPNMITKWHG